MQVWKELRLPPHRTLPVGCVPAGAVWYMAEGYAPDVKCSHQGTDFAGDVRFSNSGGHTARIRIMAPIANNAVEPVTEDAPKRIRFREFL